MLSSAQVETASQWASIVGIPLALLGLLYAGWQATQARSASEAASAAIREAVDAFGVSRALGLHGFLMRIEQTIFHASESNNISLAANGLSLWRYASVEIATVLRILGEANDDLVALTNRCNRIAALAEKDLLPGTNRPVHQTTRATRIAVAEVIGEFGSIVTALSLRLDRRDGE